MCNLMKEYSIGRNKGKGKTFSREKNGGGMFHDVQSTAGYLYLCRGSRELQ